MSDLDKNFEGAAEAVKNLKTRPNDQELLEIYGLFKQATVGDCNQPKPGMFQLKEKAKHEFWSKKAGMSQEEAKKAYIKQVEGFVKIYGLKD